MYTHAHLLVGKPEESFSTAKHAILIKKINQWTENQTETLEKTFQTTVYPEGKEFDQLAKSFNVSRKRIENWFSAKRRKVAREGMLSLSE